MVMLYQTEIGDKTIPKSTRPIKKQKDRHGAWLRGRCWRMLGGMGIDAGTAPP